MMPALERPMEASSDCQLSISPYIHALTPRAGFVNEMRKVAMKLHTREQAPKEGQQEAAPRPKAVSVPGTLAPRCCPYKPGPASMLNVPLPSSPSSQWAPTREGYLSFLVESKAVYEVLETVVQDKTHPECECQPVVSVRA